MRISESLLVVCSITVGIVAVDLVMKVLELPEPGTRVLFLSGGGLSTSNQGSVRAYSKNSELRHSAIYGSFLAYDYKFKTDQSGYRVMENNCPQKVISSNPLLISGDSFTEGLGSSTSWVNELLRLECSTKEIVNTAVVGNGIEDMVNSLRAENLHTSNSSYSPSGVIAIIDDDIGRPFIEVETNAICSYYVTNQSSRACESPVIFWNANGLAKHSLVSLAKTKYRVGLGAYIAYLKRRIKSHFLEVVNHKSARERLAIRHARLVNQLSNEFNRLAIVRLPEATPKEGKDVGLFFASLNKEIEIIDLRECPLVSSDYIRIDGHPNESGHMLIAECLSNEPRFMSLFQQTTNRRI